MDGLVIAFWALSLGATALASTSDAYGADAQQGALVVRAVVANVEYDGSSSTTTTTLDIKEVFGGDHEGSRLVVHTSVDRKRWPAEGPHRMVMYVPPREGEEITFSCTKYTPQLFKSFDEKVYCRQSLGDTFFPKVTLPDGRKIVADAQFSAVPAVSPHRYVSDFTNFNYEGEQCGDPRGCFLGIEDATAWSCGDCIDTAASWASFLDAFRSLAKDLSLRGSHQLASMLTTADVPAPAQSTP